MMWRHACLLVDKFPNLKYIKLYDEQVNLAFTRGCPSVGTIFRRVA